MQVECGVLSLLVALTCFWQRNWLRWSVPSGYLSGDSGWPLLVGLGPPMPLIGGLFVMVALLVARATKWALRTALVA